MNSCLEECPLTKINPVPRDAFHRLAIGRRTGAGQKAERTDVDTEDWLNDLTKLPNYVQHRSVAPSYHEEVCCCSQFGQCEPRFLSGNFSRFLFTQRRN